MPTEASAGPSRVIQYRHTCDTCGRVFQRATGLERHRRSAHTHENPYACEYCTLKFTRIDLLQRHVSLYHKTMSAQRKDSTTLDILLQSQQTNNQRSIPDHNNIEGRRASYPQDASYDLPFNFSEPNDSLGDMLQWLSGAIESDSNINNDGQQIIPPAISNDQSFILPASKTQSNPSTSTMTPASLSPILGVLASSSTTSSITSPEIVPSTDYTNVTCALNSFPKPEHRHMHLYRVHFSQHLPFIHLPSLDSQLDKDDELEQDLRRAMAIVGGNYESAAQGGLDQGARPLPKPCDYYGCAHLKTQTLRSIEDLQEQALNDQHPSKRVLVRRTQTMVLLQLATMFSENKKHNVAAKISHGSLIAIARELLNELNRSRTIYAKGSWAEFIEREECIRTIWAVFMVDSLHAFCYQRATWFNLSELSNVPDFSSDDLWNAVSESQFHMLRTSQNAPESICIFDMVQRLKGDAPLTSTKQLSLSGTLLTLLCLVTEIAGFVNDDTVVRKQLANRLQRASQFLENDEVISIKQAMDSHDNYLNQKLQNADKHLTRWLTLLQHSSCQHKYGNDHREAPFKSDFMPWYWAGSHFIHMLRGRTQKKESASTSIELLRARLQFIEIQNDPLEIMHLLVRIRLALQGLDGGASMQFALGKSDFVKCLPPLPSSVSICSITGLFPTRTLSQQYL